jgi:hypothetical protein
LSFKGMPALKSAATWRDRVGLGDPQKKAPADRPRLSRTLSYHYRRPEAEIGRSGAVAGSVCSDSGS